MGSIRSKDLGRKNLDDIGVENEFYYDAKLMRWCQRGEPSATAAKAEVLPVASDTLTAEASARIVARAAPGARLAVVVLPGSFNPGHR